MSSGLEASIAGTQTHMLDELSFTLPASAQYMNKREEIYWTSGANVYAANGIRTMRVNISGQGFLDMSSLVLECDVDNLSTDTALKPIVLGLEAVFQFLEISISGTTTEEIGDPSCSYGRIYTMLSKSLGKESVAMNAALSFETVPMPITGCLLHSRPFLPAVPKRSYTNHLQAYAAKQSVLYFGQFLHLVRVFRLNFKSSKMQRRP